MNSNKFAKLFIKAAVSGKLSEIIKLRHAKVRCSKCKKVTKDASDASVGTDFYCPECGAGWVVLSR
jgi:Zn finger protein HypA/HybF involved in hydrogenase expression